MNLRVMFIFSGSAEKPLPEQAKSSEWRIQQPCQKVTSQLLWTVPKGLQCLLFGRPWKITAPDLMSMTTESSVSLIGAGRNTSEKIPSKNSIPERLANGPEAIMPGSRKWRQTFLHRQSNWSQSDQDSFLRFYLKYLYLQ